MVRRQAAQRKADHVTREATWTSKQKSAPRLDIYGDRIVSDKAPSPPVDGRRLSDDLRRLYCLTGDPAFETARLVLQAYGLHVGKPIGNARRIREHVVPGDLESHGLELMFCYRRAPPSTRKRLSIRAAAEIIVSKLGLPGASFASAVDVFRRRYAAIEKTQNFPGESDLIGDTGRRIFVRPTGTPFDGLPDEGAEVADTRYWRRRLSEGNLTAEFLGGNSP